MYSNNIYRVIPFAICSPSFDGEECRLSLVIGEAGGRFTRNWYESLCESQFITDDLRSSSHFQLMHVNIPLYFSLAFNNTK